MDKKVRSIEISKRVPIVGNYDVVSAVADQLVSLRPLRLLAVVRKLLLWNNMVF